MSLTLNMIIILALFITGNVIEAWRAVKARALPAGIFFIVDAAVVLLIFGR